MAKPKTLNECRTAKDFDRTIRASGISYTERQNGTSHKVYKFDGGSVPIPQHSGDIPRGTRMAIIKMLLRCGIAVFVIAKAIEIIKQFVGSSVPGFN